MIVLSYLWILALIPLLVEKEDKEVQWHAKHGLVLALAEFVLWIGIAMVGFVIGMISDTLGCFFGLAYPILWVAAIVLHVVCIVQGTSGKRFTIPGVSEFADRF